jgi:hypothetical protein
MFLLVLTNFRQVLECGPDESATSRDRFSGKPVSEFSP